MARRNTKEDILTISLDLFATGGFEGVSLRTIAARVGIKESSLYKHFDSKHAIFEALMGEMRTRMEEAQHASHTPVGDVDALADAYTEIGLDELLSISKALFLHNLNDPFTAKFRRMLTIEQFKQNEAAEALRGYFIDASINYQTALFSQMQQQGAFQGQDPHVMALHFYAPIYLLLIKYDTLPDQVSEALILLEGHVRQFHKLYNPTA